MCRSSCSRSKNPQCWPHVQPSSPRFGQCWAQTGPSWAMSIPFFTYVGPMCGLCWAKFRPWIHPCTPLWPRAAAQPQILDPPAHKTVRFAMFFHILLIFHNINFFPPRPPKATRRTPNLAHRSAQGPQDRPARPSEHARDGVKIGQHGPRWATHTADYAPSSPKDLNKHVENPFKRSIPTPITPKTTSQHLKKITIFLCC